MAYSNHEDIINFYNKLYPLMCIYLKDNNIPITALLREFELKNIKKCSEIGKEIECVKGQWQSKKFCNCVFNNDFIYKDKVYFSEREFLRFVFIKFVKQKCMFWRN